MGGDLGSVVVVSTGGIAFVEPVNSFRFSCETRLSDQEQGEVAGLVAAFRHETAALDDRLGVYPGQGSAVYDRLNSVDSPYTHLNIVTQSWVDDDPASSRRVYLTYLDLGMIQAVYPDLFALTSMLIDLRDSRADRCSKNLSEGRK
ncbi:hypothetical protein [Congregibacter litoralis]|nr:hypothetical protein [Congregibacter litoralis]